MQYLQGLEDQPVLNMGPSATMSFVYFYCYHMGITQLELSAITDVLMDANDLDGSVDVLHLLSQDELDQWIAELQA